MLLKKCVVILTAVCMLFLSACGAPATQPDTSSQNNGAVAVSNPVHLGVPTGDFYSYNMLARCVWDMTIHDGKLYAGCGDYVNNTGGVPVMYCALDDLGNWQREGIVLDEQIGRFLMLDDKLTIPGWDPKGMPESGTYYQLEDGKWQTKNGLPDRLHNFDLVRYDGKLFAGIGASKGQTPIVVSENGIDFERVPMLRNGTPVDTTEGEMIRTYNLWVLNGTLYADFHYDNLVLNKKIVEVYRYENGQFVWCVGLGKTLNFDGVGSQTLPRPWADAVIEDTLFITIGRLYMTADMVEFTEVRIPNDAWVYDIYTHNDVMYLLTASQGADGMYSVAVYSCATADPYDFQKDFVFESEAQPTALAVGDSGYFIAFGNWNSTTTETNGQVLYFAKE